MSHWHITVAETALVGVGIGFLSSYLTYMATRRGSRDLLKAQEQSVNRTIEAQRALASDQRLWDQQSEAYRALMDALMRLPSFGRLERDDLLERPMKKFLTQRVNLEDAMPSIYLYGTTRLAIKYREFMLKIADTSDAIHSYTALLTGGNSKNAIDELIERRDLVVEVGGVTQKLAQDLMVVLREEIRRHSGTPGTTRSPASTSAASNTADPSSK